MTVLDLYCGAGGASLALASLGLDAVGIDHDPDACATHAAAGHRTIRADLEVTPFAHLAGRVRLLHASPPCQPFSAAGSGDGEDDGRDGMPATLRAVAEARPDVVTIENVPGLAYARHVGYLRWVLADLRALGYEVAWRVLNAADYGVPQTRRRLVIVARRDGAPIVWPTPTHTETPGLFTAGWVSMADALGWGMTARPFLTVAGTSGGYDPQAVGGSEARRRIRVERDAGRWLLNTGQDFAPGASRDDGQTRPTAAPSPTVGARSGVQWQWRLRPGADTPRRVRDFRPRRRDADRPAPTIALGKDVASWAWERVDGDTVVRVELDELAALQSFPPDYPFHGNRSSVARQIGNAVPAPMLAAVVGANL